MQQLVDRVLGEHLTVTRAVEPAPGVAHDLAADAIDDDDRVGRLVERGQQPVLHCFGTRDPLVRFAGRFGDGVDQTDVVGSVRRLTRTSRSACRQCTEDPGHHRHR